MLTAPNVVATSANAGPGNDSIVISTRSAKTLNGQDGDDTLRINGVQLAAPTTFDGGSGRDRASFDGIVGDTGRPAAINGSLADKSSRDQAH